MTKSGSYLYLKVLNGVQTDWVFGGPIPPGLILLNSIILVLLRTGFPDYSLVSGATAETETMEDVSLNRKYL